MNSSSEFKNSRKPLTVSFLTLGLALVLRLCLMPIALHPDLLAIQYYTSLLWTEGVWDFYGSWWGKMNLEYFGITFYPPLAYYLIAFSHGISCLFSPSFIRIMGDYHALFLQNPQIDAVKFFARHALNDRLWFTFWSKWLYLLVDCLSFGVFALFFKDSAERRLQFQKAWLWSPVLLFSTYIFGQYRILPAFFMILILVFLSHRKLVPAFFCLGCLALLDHYPWPLFIPYFLIFIKNDRTSIYSLIALAAPLILVLSPLAISSRGQVAYAYASPLYVKLAMTGIVNAGGVWTAQLTRFLMALGYGALLAGLWKFRKAGFSGSWDQKLNLSVDATLCVLLLIYATGRTSTHYFMWILPFWIYRHTLGVPWPKMLSVLAVGLLFFFNLDNRELNMGLFIPLNPEYFMSLPSLHEIMAPYVPWGKFIGVARVCFSFLCLFFVYRICRESLQKTHIK
ncbi:MAG: hypothetical protein A3C35_02430 [Omnitrophica bacterium RIFCSPHIGHO2_02_FULL_46_11]|nr:MAG: hypothetical protein A3C35_02430 [Omnitrophica bacterium RIFCSPHIGHO2_02_FULL_46_11]OGW87211.1 MAG: hypothetical protein A3A81_08110 [Omnitrophica bacterium RIFCSPLOWO2_01_FULL_45_10b]